MRNCGRSWGLPALLRPKCRRFRPMGRRRHERLSRARSRVGKDGLFKELRQFAAGAPFIGVDNKYLGERKVCHHESLGGDNKTDCEVGISQATARLPAAE